MCATVSVFVRTCLHDYVGMSPNTACSPGCLSIGPRGCLGMCVCLYARIESVRAGANRREPVRTGGNRCEPVRTGANQCEPVRTGAHQIPDARDVTM